MTDPFDEKLAETIKAGRTNDAVFIAHARQDIPALVAALEAVLELHKEVQWAESWPTCIHCNDGEGSPLAYPCPTVAAIQSALGEQT